MKTTAIFSILAIAVTVALPAASATATGVYVDFITEEDGFLTRVIVVFRSYTQITALDTDDRHKVFRLVQTSKVYSGLGCTGAVFGVATPPDSKIGTPQDPLKVGDKLGAGVPWPVGICVPEETYETWAHGYILWSEASTENDICRIPNCQTAP